MKILVFFYLVCICIYSQNRILVSMENQISLSAKAATKIVSGVLLQHLNEKKEKIKKGLSLERDQSIVTILYFENFPTPQQRQEMTKNGIELFPATWIPKINNHSYGFLVAKIPVMLFSSAIELECIKKVDTAEEENHPLNNQAAKKIRADSVWIQGYTGAGVKIAVLDSGLDSEPSNDDLPGTIQKSDYSNYPTSIDTIVENMVTGHGTHVTGTAIGRGILSSVNTGNGSGSYSGIGYGADLIFLKIGNDATGGSSTAAEIAAIQSAVDTFNAKILTMSYGGWQTYHDGSSAIEQAANYAVRKGALFFAAAGNDGQTARHFSNTVDAQDTSDFIQINVSGAGTSNTALYMNLVWADGIENKGLTFQLYNNSQQLLSPVILQPATESMSTGVESRYGYYDSYLPAGNGTYYLKVINPSNSSQFFHVYEYWNNGCVKFNNPDPMYTVVAPASADSVFAVGAFNSRSTWTAYNSSSHSFGYTLDDLSPFSSRGPRVDGVLKPDITAPGSVLVSIRDRDMYQIADDYFIDNDGIIPGGNADYLIMQGTSMASPAAAGAAALLLQKFGSITPIQAYSAMKNNAASDSYTGSVPNNTWGYGKLNINQALEDAALPVELNSFTVKSFRGVLQLSWSTITEQNNAGFFVERKNAGQDFWKGIGFVAGKGNSFTPVIYRYEDYTAELGKNYIYRLKQTDNDGSYKYSHEMSAVLYADRFILYQNFPNPFNNTTRISYYIPEQGKVQLNIYSVLGQKPLLLINEEQEPGAHHIAFDAKNLSSGVYFMELQCNGYRYVKKLTVLK